MRKFEQSLLSASIALTFGSGMAVAAGVIPDGGTATSVTTDGAGKQSIIIAAPVSQTRVSHNTYSQFSVGKPGVDIINTSTTNAARYIVNEVTSTNPSLIEGPVSVIGARATVILANPNGITVNGGSFVNTGSVVLSTGKIGFDDFKPGAIIEKRNIVLNTSRGQIEIGPEGLAGSLRNLELVAKEVKINGPVTNEFGSADNINGSGLIRINTGETKATIDSGPTPGNPLDIAYVAANSATPGAILVDITPLGSLTAGRIQIAVNDRGAGVRHAGSLLANIGDFTLASSGKISIEGGRSRAARDLIVGAPVKALDTDGSALFDTAPTIRITSGHFASGRDTVMRASTIRVDGGSFQAGSETQTGNIVLGMQQDMTGPIVLGAASTDAGFQPLTFTANGGIGIYGGNQIARIAGAKLKAHENLEVKAERIEFDTHWASGQAQSASIDSAVGSVTLFADYDILSRGGEVQGSAGVNIHSTNLLLDVATENSTDKKSRLVSNGGTVALSIENAIHIRGSDLAASEDVLAKSATFIQEAVGATGSSTVAVNGTVLIETSGDIRNSGSLIQGNIKNSAVTGSLGAVTLESRGSITNESLTAGPQAVIFGADGNIVGHAAGDIINHGARIISNKGLSLIAVGDVQNIVGKTDAAAGGAKQEYHQNDRNWLGINRRSSGFSVDYGSLLDAGHEAFLVANDGDLTIDSDNVVNSGGNLYANGDADIRLTAQHKINNQGLATGKALFERSCRLFICKTTAESNVAVVGGLISAGRDIVMSAGDEIANIGGRVLALRDINLDTPKVTARAVTGYTAITRHQGMRAFFGDTWAKIYAADQGGAFTANQGALKISGTAYTEGATLAAANGVEATGGIVTLRPVQRDSVTIGDAHIGLTSWFWK
jgi:filamentous hemagglutinin family protein